MISSEIKELYFLKLKCNRIIEECVEYNDGYWRVSFMSFPAMYNFKNIWLGPVGW